MSGSSDGDSRPRSQHSSEEMLNIVLQTSMDGFCTLDNEGNLLQVNSAFCQMLGYSEEELLAMKMSDLDIGGTSNDVIKRIKKINRYGQDSFETKHQRKDGTAIDVEVYARSITTKRGPLIVVFLRDVTGTKSMERTKLELEEQLRHAQKMEAVGTLAGGIAHDFNNLLTGIIGNVLFVLSFIGEDDPAKEPLNDMLAAAQRASKLTKQLLAFSARQVLQPSSIDLLELVHGVETMISKTLTDSVTLRIVGENICAKADQSAIELVLMNLAANSAYAMQRQGEVVISVLPVKVTESDKSNEHPDLPVGEYAQLRFSDTGCGICKDDLSRVFEPFFTTKKPGEGTGLGLSTVYGTIHQHGGHIFVESTQGAGTTFTIYLPKCESGKKPAKAAKKLHMPSGSETILVVEDQAIVRKMLDNILTSAGYNVILANNGVEAMFHLKKHRDDINLIIADVIMPLMNGTEFASEIIESGWPIQRILFMSGYPRDNLQKLGLDTASWNLIGKPFMPVQLLETIRKLLD